MNPAMIPEKQIPWHPTIETDACIGVRDCIKICEKGVLEWDTSIGQPVVGRPGNCEVGCTACMEACPVKAIRLPTPGQREESKGIPLWKRYPAATLSAEQEKLAGAVNSRLRRVKAWVKRVSGAVTLPSLFLIMAVVLALPALASAQGWWRGSPITPGFDRNTVIRVSGTAADVSLNAHGNPATLTLECPRDTYRVILGPGWYFDQLQADIREGDPLVVEGSTMMDRSGNLHLVAARVTDGRTGAVFELRDEMGRPLWMQGPRPGRMMW